MKTKNNIENLIKKALEESLSKGDSPIVEANLTKTQLDKREDYLKQLKKNKKELVKRYGKDAESVMYGRATNLAKKAVSEMNKEKLKELVRKSLMQENEEFSEEDIKSYMDTFNVSREEAIKGLKQSYKDYKSEMGEGKKTDMDKDGDIDSKDYLLKRDAAIQKAKGEMKEDLDLGHQDNEPHMIKAELYRIGKYAMELYQMVDGFEGKGEVDFPAWWQSKITKAQEMMVSAKHYLDFETKEPAIDAMVGVASDEEMLDDAPMMEGEIGKADILSGELYKLKGKIQDAFFDKIRKFINMGSYEDAEYLLNRVKGQMKEKSLAETIAQKLKSK
jgi:NACalpha-BTF3-like transcription factor